ncbi:hypothetical protein [Streptomyces sp. NPDC005046]
MNAPAPGLVVVQLLDGSERAFRVILEALDTFITAYPPWPGARAAQGLPDDWRWTIQVDPYVFTTRAHLSPPESGTVRAVLTGSSTDTLQVKGAIRGSFKVREEKPPRTNDDGTITRSLIVTPSQRASDEDDDD